MSSITDYSTMFSDSITLASFASRDAYGAPTVGSAVSYNARVVFKDQLARDKEGQEVVAKGACWIEGTPTISPEDTITLSDATTPPIITTETYWAPDGVHHVKVLFGG
jgi:hypothetical protein